MMKSKIPILEHVPVFLNYCKSKGLSEKTYIAYKSFLRRFIEWLKKENKNILLPHELTVADIHSYKSYLSSLPGKNGQTLKTITQNYYLIALRALLGYFAAKDIESLPANKIYLFSCTSKRNSLIK